MWKHFSYFFCFVLPNNGNRNVQQQRCDHVVFVWHVAVFSHEINTNENEKISLFFSLCFYFILCVTVRVWVCLCECVCMNVCIHVYIHLMKCLEFKIAPLCSHYGVGEWIFVATPSWDNRVSRSLPSVSSNKKWSCILTHTPTIPHMRRSFVDIYYGTFTRPIDFVSSIERTIWNEIREIIISYMILKTTTSLDGTLYYFIWSMWDPHRMEKNARCFIPSTQDIKYFGHSQNGMTPAIKYQRDHLWPKRMRCIP